MTIIILSLKDNVLHHVSNIKKNQMYHGRPSSIYLKQTMKQKHCNNKLSNIKMIKEIILEDFIKKIKELTIELSNV